MALFGFTLIAVWLAYKFFTKWLWWCIGFGILVNVIAWFMKFGWTVIMIAAFAAAIGLLAMTVHNYRIQHQNK